MGGIWIFFYGHNATLYEVLKLILVEIQVASPLILLSYCNHVLLKRWPSPEFVDMRFYSDAAYTFYSAVLYCDALFLYFIFAENLI